MALYTYPQVLDAMQKIAVDLLAAIGSQNGKRYTVKVIGDPSASTASVVWTSHHRLGLSGAVECTIRFPVKDPNGRVTQQEFDNYAGYVFHEVGHPAFTDWSVWQLAVVANQHRLLNALEDVRIEKALIDAGIAANGKRVLTDLVRQLDYTAIKADFNPNKSSRIGFVMGFLGRHRNGYDMDATLLTSKLIPGSPVSDAIVWALPELEACQSTQDCLDLARKLIAALPKDKPEAPKEDQPEGNETATQPGEAAEGEEAEGEEAEATQPGEAAEGEEAEGEEAEGEAEGENAQNPKGEAQKDGGDSEAFSDRDVEEVDLTPDAGDFEEGSQEAVNAAAVTKAIRSAMKGGAKLPQAATNLTLVREALAMEAQAHKASKQRALLARCLRRNEEDLYEGGLRHGKLDRRAFAALAAGSPNVMGRRSMIDGYETDVVVLVDCSYSMKQREITAAATLALVVAQACAQVGVSCSTYGFGTEMGVSPAPYGLVEVKGGRGKPECRKFAGLVASTGGCTPLAESLLSVANMQLARAANKRRVIFVISDGGDDEGEARMTGVANYVEDTMGAELANLFIGWKPLGCFRNEVAIQPGKDIAEAGLAQLTAKLSRGA